MLKISLIRNFSLICLAVLVVFCFVLGGIITNDLERNMLMRAEQLTARFASDEIKNEFLRTDFMLYKDIADYNKIAEKIRHLTLIQGIERIKIWNKDKIVVWADTKELVGQHFPNNEGLIRALNGEIVSDISTLEKVEHKYEHKFEKLMELYIPIRFEPQENIEIVFEIYQNVDQLYADISRQKLNVWFLTIFGFLILYFMLFGIVWRASKLIEKQTSKIVKTEVIRKSEVRLSKVFNATPDSIVISRLQDGHLMYFNPAFTSMVEFTKKEVIGKTITGLNIWVNLEEWESLIKKLEADKEVRGFETNFRSKSGKIIPGYISASVIEMDGDECIVFMIRDITSRKQNEEKLKNNSMEMENLTNDLRKLATQLSIEEERTRKRFARVLHEQVGQNLATIKLVFKKIMEKSPLDEEKTRENINNAISVLSDTMTATKELTADLYPSILDDLGLIPAIKWYTETILIPNGIKVSLDINNSVEGLPADMKLSLFRVIQESFQNIINHASATEVTVELKNLGGILKLSIKDNGTGFDKEKIKEKTGKGIGLMLIKERALSLGGVFSLDSAIEKGTEIVLKVPLKI